MERISANTEAECFDDRLVDGLVETDHVVQINIIRLVGVHP
jgi:hypothetical protein